MSDVDVLPEMKQIIGAMLFASKEPLSVGRIRTVLRQTAEQEGGPTRNFAEATAKDIQVALAELREDLAGHHTGFHIMEVAKGFRLENDGACGPWLRVLLNKGKGNRLSRPALETLAIIAYRQPCTRAEIESVRGVAVDQIVRNLLELELVKVTGRSEMPGRPWLFGTTNTFLEHFGLRDLQDLPGIEELRRRNEQQGRKQEGAGGDEPGAGDGTGADDPGAAAAAEPSTTSDPEADAKQEGSES